MRRRAAVRRQPEKMASELPMVQRRHKHHGEGKAHRADARASTARSTTERKGQKKQNP